MKSQALETNTSCFLNLTSVRIGAPRTPVIWHANLKVKPYLNKSIQQNKLFWGLSSNFISFATWFRILFYVSSISTTLVYFFWLLWDQIIVKLFKKIVIVLFLQSTMQLSSDIYSSLVRSLMEDIISFDCHLSHPNLSQCSINLFCIMSWSNPMDIVDSLPQLPFFEHGFIPSPTLPLFYWCWDQIVPALDNQVITLLMEGVHGILSWWYNGDAF